MKKLLSVLLVLGCLSAAISAQSGVLPKKGDLGVSAGFSSDVSEIDLVYQISDQISIEPSIGFYSSNSAVTAGGTTTDYPYSYFIMGVGGFYTVKSFDALALMVGPSVAFSYVTDETTGVKHAKTYWTLTADAKAQYMFSKNLGIFAKSGFYLYSRNDENTVTSSETLYTVFGIQSLALGGTIYFK